MTLPLRVPRLKTCLRIATLAALAAFLFVFDWNWFREPLAEYLTGTSQRRVQFDDLRVSVDTSFEPTVHLRGVRIDNAAWADARRPLVVAAEADFTFSWRSVVERRPIVSRLRLVDADVDLERRADGLRNWRLRSPDNREPGRVKVLSLQAQRTRIHFIHQALSLDLTAIASDAATPAALAHHPGVTLSRQIDVDGHLGDVDFTGQAQAGPLLTFLETGTAIPLRGHVAAGGARLNFEGTVADLFDPTAVEATLRLAGADLARLGQVFSLTLPHTPPYAAQAELRKEPVLTDYTFSALRMAIGPSELTGSLDYDPAGERPVLHATLAGERVRQADLRPAPATAGPARKPAEPAEPAGPWRSLDAHVEMKVKSFEPEGALPPLQNLRLTAHLEDGALEVTPLHFNLAGGQATARLAYDTRPELPVGEAELTLRLLRLEKLLPDLPENARLSGPLNGRLRLKGQGRTLDALAGSAGGLAELTVDNGSLASTLEAKLALDGGKLLRGLFTGERPVALRCGVLSMDFKHGRGTARQVWLETEHTQTRGSGTVDLRAGDYELLLAPHSKDHALFALNKPLRVHGGSFTASPQVDVGTGGTAVAGAPGCKLIKASEAQE